MNSSTSFVMKSCRFKMAFLLGASMCTPFAPAIAGFEWVANQSKAVEQNAEPAASVSNVETLSDKDMADSPLPPLPGFDAPVKKIMVEDAHPVIQTRVVGDKPSVVPAPKQAPTRMIVTPSEEPASQEVEAVTPVAFAKTPLSKTRIVVPENAPNSAVQKINAQKSGKVQVPTLPLTDAVIVDMSAEAIDDESALDIAVEPDASADPVVGFGSDIPLALALRQVVPAGYSFSFAESVNVGQRVSWSGGKPWADVLNDMIMPLSMKANIRGKHVHISSPESLMPAPELAPQAAAQMEMLNNIETAAGGEPEDFLSRSINSEKSARGLIQDPGEVPAAQPKDTIQVIEKKVSRDFEPKRVIVADVSADVSEITAPVMRDRAVWEAEKGASLRSTLDQWSEEFGANLVWDANYDYRLRSDIFVSGEFTGALKAVVAEALAGENAPDFVFKSGVQGEPATLIIKDQQSAS